jgi:hypothetical protein
LIIEVYENKRIMEISQDFNHRPCILLDSIQIRILIKTIKRFKVVL